MPSRLAAAEVAWLELWALSSRASPGAQLQREDGRAAEAEAEVLAGVAVALSLCPRLARDFLRLWGSRLVWAEGTLGLAEWQALLAAVSVAALACPELSLASEDLGPVSLRLEVGFLRLCRTEAALWLSPDLVLRLEAAFLEAAVLVIRVRVLWGLRPPATTSG